jgi:MbtH protein
MGATTTVWIVIWSRAEDAYMIWPADREHQLRPGWEFVGKRGTREECLQHIEEIWTDMRPLSEREERQERERREREHAGRIIDVGGTSQAVSVSDNEPTTTT